MRIQRKVSNLFFSKGEVLVEIPNSSRNCGCPQHECRMCYEMMKKKQNTKTHPREEDADTGIVLIPLSFY